MGDRRVVGFRENEDAGTVFMYSQWGGESQVTDLIAAIEKAEPRWNDPSYATRIALSQLIGNEWNNETGHGIYTDNTVHGADYPFILIVEWDEGRVKVCSNNDSTEVMEIIAFADFIKEGLTLVAEATL